MGTAAASDEADDDGGGPCPCEKDEAGGEGSLAGRVSGHAPRSTDLWATAAALLLLFGGAMTQRCPETRGAGVLSARMVACHERQKERQARATIRDKKRKDTSKMPI